jgi:hypothetical protein
MSGFSLTGTFTIAILYKVLHIAELNKARNPETSLQIALQVTAISTRIFQCEFRDPDTPTSFHRESQEK